MISGPIDFAPCIDRQEYNSSKTVCNSKELGRLFNPSSGRMYNNAFSRYNCFKDKFICKPLGNAIKKARNEKGWTREKLSDMTGV
jgi:ribosome-binding protein aMBF1 (putative translation factor)